MNAVIDANLIVSLVLPLPYSVQTEELIYTRKQAGAELLSPALWSYEVVSVLRRAYVQQILTEETLTSALNFIWDLGIQPLFPTLELHLLSLVWSERLQSSKAYDSAYLAAAELLQVEFWTADKRLASAAQRLGAKWVHVIGSE
jgi:predicted nucleic acid-binding protein